MTAVFHRRRANPRGWPLPSEPHHSEPTIPGGPVTPRQYDYSTYPAEPHDDFGRHFTPAEDVETPARRSYDSRSNDSGSLDGSIHGRQYAFRLYPADDEPEVRDGPARRKVKSGRVEYPDPSAVPRSWDWIDRGKEEVMPESSDIWKKGMERRLLRGEGVDSYGRGGSCAAWQSWNLDYPGSKAPYEDVGLSGNVWRHERDGKVVYNGYPYAID